MQGPQANGIHLEQDLWQESPVLRQWLLRLKFS